MRCPRSRNNKVIHEITPLISAISVFWLMSIDKIPMIAKIPAIISKIKITLRENGTLFAKIVLEKWDFSHSTFPFQSDILSTPDCKNVIAKNTKMMISVIWFIEVIFYKYIEY